MMADNIMPESQVEAHMIPPLDPEVFALSEREMHFLRSAVSNDDEEMKQRVLEVQQEAYEKYPYPCIRAFHYVNLMMSANPIYPEVVEAGKSNNTLFLDLGCCMGTDVRKLAHDGYPTSRILGCDLRQEYIDLGYKLFADKNTTAVRFFTSDVFSIPVDFSPSNIEVGSEAEITQLEQLRGKVTHLYTGALFHLFDAPTQYAIALRLAALLRRERGAVIFGRHQGLEHEGMIDDHLGRIRYGHSATSWPQMWKQVFTEAEGHEFAEKRLIIQATLTEGFDGKVFKARGQNQMLVWEIKII